MISDVVHHDILPKIKTPALIIWGEQDRVLHVDNADLFHKLLPNSKKVIFCGIGHVPQFEDSARTGKEIKEFIGNL
ncbi:MAG: alpha/beta fold hydrolase [Thiohalomonadales bacterium]